LFFHFLALIVTADTIYNILNHVRKKLDCKIRTVEFYDDKKILKTSVSWLRGFSKTINDLVVCKLVLLPGYLRTVFSTSRKGFKCQILVFKYQKHQLRGKISEK
jgi:hypothetical protein